MSKWRKLFLLASCLTAGFLTSCDDSTGSSSKPGADPALVGSWTATENDSGETITIVASFAANNTMTLQVTSSGMSSDPTATGTWSTSGGKLSTTIGNESSTMAYSINGTTLTTTEDDGSITTFTRIATPTTTPIVTTPTDTTTATTTASPAFSPTAGTYSAAQTVTITSTTSGATIYYTTDGSTPTTYSAIYSGPITVGVSKTLKAIAIKGGISSTVSTATFTISTGSTGSDSASLVGSWSAHESDSSAGMVFVFDEIITLSSNGNFSATIHYEYSGIEEDTTITGTWSVSSSTLTTIIAGETSSVSFTINGNTLTIAENGDETVYTRVTSARVASTSSPLPLAFSPAAIHALLGIDLRQLIAARTQRSR